MTPIPDLTAVEFLHYNRWANLKLIDACSQLTAEQLAISGPGAYGTIYDTLRHFIRVEGRYFERLTGTRLEPPFAWEDNPPLDAMRAYAERVSGAWIEAAAKINFTDTVQTGYQGKPYRFKAMTFLIQLVNHGIEHRTNITTILAQQGIPAPVIDGWEYTDANPDRMGT